MLGETLALLAAAAYGCAGVSIVHSKTTAQGDNGALFVGGHDTDRFRCTLARMGTTSAVTLKRRGRSLGPLHFLHWQGLRQIFSDGKPCIVRPKKIGAVRAGLLRRLIPVFALP